MAYSDDSVAWKQELPGSEKLVLLYLAKCRHDHSRCPSGCKIPIGLCNPSVDDIAAKTGLSPSTVSRAIKSLAEFNTINVWRVGLAGGPRGKNYYVFPWAKGFIPKRGQLVKFTEKVNSHVTMTDESHVTVKNSPVTMTSVHMSPCDGNLESSILNPNPEKILKPPLAKKSQGEAEKILPEEIEKEVNSDVTLTSEKLVLKPMPDWEDLHPEHAG